MVVPGLLRRVSKALPSIFQAIAIVAFIHLVGQNVLTKFGSARYKFGRNYQSSGSDKVQKVIKYIDKSIPRYSKVAKTTTTPATTTSTTPPPPPPMDQLEEEQERRRRTMQDACARMNSSSNEDQEITNMSDFLMKLNLPTRPMWQNLYCSKEHHISYCPSNKAAANFLFKKMLLIAPSKKYTKKKIQELDADPAALARKEFGFLDSWDQYPEFTKTGTTIVFGRHPFERLLSAFRDKLEDPQVKGRAFNEYYYNKYGRKIVMYFRKEKITGPTFKYPRFSEFLEFLLDRDMRYDDEHWSPFFKDCSLCQIDYNFIGKFETLYWDMHLLANKTKLVKLWDDPSDFFQSSTYKAITLEYFRQVEKNLIRKVYKRYKLDFDLFGYSPDEYIEVGKLSEEEMETTTLLNEPEKKNAEAASKVSLEAHNEAEVNREPAKDATKDSITESNVTH